MSIRQTSIVVGLFALFIGTSVVLAEPLFKNSSQPTTNSEQLVAQNPDTTPQDTPQRGPGNRRGQRGNFGPGRLLQQLGLSDQQQQKLEAIKQKYQGQLQPLRENMKTLREDLGTLMTGTASNQEIRAKHQQLVASRQKMENIRFESMLEMREILTPEQRSKLGQLMEQRRENFRQRFTEGPDGDE
ncbi:Spy/CpxP family protein refolding chaperone [Gloeothece verrucosa]|uniref:Periplasmic heavy metal sensor n=1 Tax=Gloeothece verrucosa (strain PCC 7822) TaxID=497965 RepID=E0U583_GLOV7|nr:Spy/CpxP family protein refolding chaperone [Gloeothece verrucosa]ADN12362.1 protein of unknown function Spy-related protein [Gloeothece verrucosa PCC 7822]